MVELTWTVVVIHSDGCWFAVGNYSFAHLHRYDRTIAFCAQLKQSISKTIRLTVGSTCCVLVLCDELHASLHGFR